MRIDHSRFNHHQPVGEVDLKNSIHARQANDHASLCRECTPAQSCTRAATDEWNLVAGTNADNRLHRLGGAG